MGIAATLFPIAMMLAKLFAGFVISVKNIPDWWIWMYWASPHR